MPACPLCQTETKDDFGVAECANCGAQLIIHMDGRVEYSGADSVPAPEPEPEASNDGPPQEPAAEDFAFAAEAPQEFDYQPSPEEQPEQPQQEEPPPPPPSSISDEESFLLGPSEGTGVAQQVEAPEDQSPVPPPPPTTPSDSPDLSDIAGFGNSDLAGNRDGPLRYHLSIEGIDTADVREAFREAITDRKFMWDQDQILRTIRNGKVIIPNVAPAKAYMLISRLRNLPVEVTWEQHALQQS